MSKLKIIKGDLIALAKQGEFDMIFHGCNCFCTMGSGIAKQIREEFPEAYDADLDHPIFYKGDERKLGTWTAVLSDHFPVIIYNLYTQWGFGNDKAHFEYDSFGTILRKFEIMLGKQSRIYKLGFPLIGCGLAGGDPVIVKKMLSDFADKVAEYGHDVTLVEFGD